MGELLAEYQRLVTALEEATARCAALEQVEVTGARAHVADKASWAARLAEAEAAVAHAWQRTLDLEREREQLTCELEAATRRHGTDCQEVSRLLEAVRRADGARAAAAAEVESLRAALASAQAAVTAAQEEARQRQAEGERLEATADAARAEAERLRVELEAVRARDREMRSQLEGEIARATADLQDARRQAQEAERARAAATAEVESLASALSSTQTGLQRLEDETRRAGGEMERLRTAEQTARGEGDELRRELQDVRVLVTKAENEVTALRAKLVTAAQGRSNQQQGSRGDRDGRIGTTS